MLTLNVNVMSDTSDILVSAPYFILRPQVELGAGFKTKAKGQTVCMAELFALRYQGQIWESVYHLSAYKERLCSKFLGDCLRFDSEIPPGAQSWSFIKGSGWNKTSLCSARSVLTGFFLEKFYIGTLMVTKTPKNITSTYKLTACFGAKHAYCWYI